MSRAAHLHSPRPEHLSSSKSRQRTSDGDDTPAPRSRQRKSPTIASSLRLWIEDCHSQGFSPKTLKERPGFIQRLIWWFRHEEGIDEPTIEDLDTPTIRRFLSYLREPNEEGRFGNPHTHCREPAKPSTVFGYWREITAFCNWLTAEGYFDASPIANLKRPKVPQHLIEPFTEAQVKALLQATNETASPTRNKVIIVLLAETGLRVSELASLTVGSVQHESITVLGKGNKKRMVYLGTTTRRLVRTYISKERGEAEDSDALFIADGGTKKGEPFTPNGIRIMLRNLGKLAGVDSVRCSPHTFRHFFAVQSLRHGMSGYELMRLLGHTELDMTKRYLNLTNEDLQRAALRSSPIDRMGIR